MMLGHEDVYEKELDLELIVQSLRQIGQHGYDMVFTHNQVGEYGHPHHISVHKAVKSVFKKPYFFGYNTFSDMDIKLNAWELEKKRRILNECYFSQSSKSFIKLFDIAMERLISPIYVEASIEASFFGRNDLWSYEGSSYETARFDRIVSEIQKLPISNILEVGAHEGFLTERLTVFSEVVAHERSEVALERGRQRVPQATWCLGDFESNLDEALRAEPELVLFSEVLYYFRDYKNVLAALKGKSRFVVAQNVSKFHKQVESYMIGQGWNVVVSSSSNPFGLGIYADSNL